MRSALNENFSFVTTVGKFGVIILISIFSFLTFTRLCKNEYKKTYTDAIFYALIFYVFVNVLTYFLGFQNQENVYRSPRPALMLQIINIYVNRVSFPFSGGINTFGFVAGAGLVVSVLILFLNPRKNSKFFGIIGLISSIIAVFLTDSRGALLFSCLTIFLALIFPKNFVNIWRWLPLIIPAVPIVVIFFQQFIPYEIIQGLLRNPTTYSVDILSGRQQIWRLILEHIQDFRLIHLIGYGYHGQVISGVSQSYSYLFANWVISDSASAHNFILQTFLDLGYLGFIVVSLLTASLTFTSAQINRFTQKDESNYIQFFLLFYLILAGSTEVILTSDHLELYIIFIFLWASILTTQVKTKNKLILQ